MLILSSNRCDSCSNHQFESEQVLCFFKSSPFDFFPIPNPNLTFYLPSLLNQYEENSFFLISWFAVGGHLRKKTIKNLNLLKNFRYKSSAN